MLYTVYTLKQAVDFNMLTLQSNAERVLKNRGDDKSPLGRIKKLGLVPILWVVNISMMLKGTGFTNQNIKRKLVPCLLVISYYFSNNAIPW